MERVKRYSIVLRGNVQGVGFRTLIMGLALRYNVKGFPPANDRDGSVKMIVEGEEESLMKFLNDINVWEEAPSGIKVEELEKKEIAPEFPIPASPALEIEELMKVPKKLDEGVQSLKNIESSIKNVDTKLNKLDNIESSIKNVDTKLNKLDNIDTKLNDMPRRIADELKEVLGR